MVGFRSHAWLIRALALGGVAIALCAARADASILAPSPVGFDADQEFHEMGAAGAGAASHRQEEGPSKDSETPLEWVLQCLPASDANSGATSSSSSLGGAGAGGPVLMVSLVGPPTPDLRLLGWLQGEQRFALPMPPGTDLLRPPRDWQNFAC
jgi:hypothetical protein